MSRDEGFPHADVATVKHSDPKFRALWRLLKDEAEMNAAVVLYEAVQLASWQHGERISADDAAPLWMSDVMAPTDALMTVGLLDAEKCIPERAWQHWFRPAHERREGLRDKWRRANARRRGKAESRGDTPGSPRGGNGGTAAPDTQSDSQSINHAVKQALRAGSDGSKDPDKERDEAIARAMSVLNDPEASEDRKAGARFSLERLRT